MSLEEGSVYDILSTNTGSAPMLPVGFSDIKKMLGSILSETAGNRYVPVDQESLLVSYEGFANAVYRQLYNNTHVEPFTAHLRLNDSAMDTFVRLQYGVLDSLELAHILGILPTTEYQAQQTLKKEGKAKAATVIRTLGYTSKNNGGTCEDQYALFYMLEGITTLVKALKNHVPGTPLPNMQYICLPSFQAGGLAPKSDVVKWIKSFQGSILETESNILLQFLDSLRLLDNNALLTLHGTSKGAVVAYHMARKLASYSPQLLMTRPVGFERYQDDIGLGPVAILGSIALTGDQQARAQIMQVTGKAFSANNSAWNSAEAEEIVRCETRFKYLSHASRVTVTLARGDMLTGGLLRHVDKAKEMYIAQGATVKIFDGNHSMSKFTPDEMKIQAENLVELME